MPILEFIKKGTCLLPSLEKDQLYFNKLIPGQIIQVEIIKKKLKMKQRTLQQNKALHLYCKLLAESLNDAGLDMKKTLKPEIDIKWTMQTVKDYLWRPIQKALLQKESTTELTTVDPTEIYETLNRHLSEKFGISVEFPSYFKQ